MRQNIIAGNWKMNKIPSEAKAFALELKKSLKNANDGVGIIISPTFTALAGVSDAIKGTNIKLAAQNMNENEKGAYTGEISADMLLDISVEYVILGHSERRHIYKESNELINKKVLVALEKGLKPILCVGELLEEREAGKTNSVVREQLVSGLKSVKSDDLKNVIVAYEPVWAIGTGKVATPEIAEKVHSFIREEIKKLYDEKVSDDLCILYGGSVKPENVDGLMAKDDIDGALVGGAALKVDSFTRLVNFKK